MKTKFLFPYQFKRVGWILLIPSAILGFITIFDIMKFQFLDLKVFAIYSSHFGWNTLFGIENNNIADEIFGILCIIGAIFLAFSKEKHEDEFIAKTRMESLVWATYINYAILIICILFFYEIAFLYVMIFNMFTILILFIIRFNYILYRSRKSLQYEK